MAHAMSSLPDPSPDRAADSTIVLVKGVRSTTAAENTGRLSVERDIFVS
jgi:hypothetical protein